MPSTSAPAVQLVDVPDAVWDLITSGLFYGALGVLTSVAMHHPNLDFATICSGNAEGLSMEDIHSIGESLLPHARSVADQVSAQWVMDVRHEDMARSLRMAQSLGQRQTSLRLRSSRMSSRLGVSSMCLRRPYRQ